jgi:hypothetical protein
VFDNHLRRSAATGLAALLLSIAAPALAADPSPAPTAAPPVPASTIVPGAEDARAGAIARMLYEQARAGTIDHARLAPAVAAAVTPAVEAALAAQFGALPEPAWRYLGYRDTRNGRAQYYLLTYPGNALRMVVALDKAGLVSTLLFQPASLPSPAPSPSPTP